MTEEEFGVSGNRGLFALLKCPGAFFWVKSNCLSISPGSFAAICMFSGRWFTNCCLSSGGRQHAEDVSCTVATETKHIHSNGMRNSVVDHKISALQRSHPALSQKGHNCSFRRRRHQDA